MCRVSAVACGVFLASGKTFRCRARTPPVMVGLSGGLWGLPCIRQDLSLQSTDPQVMAGLNCGRRGFPCIRQDLQSADPQSWRGSELAYGLLSAWASAPVALGLPPRPRAAKLLRSTWDSCSPAQDRTCIPCITRQVLNCWTTREVSLLYF